MLRNIMAVGCRHLRIRSDQRYGGVDLCDSESLALR